MKLVATDWNGVALDKLVKVMGPNVGRQLAAQILEELGLQEVSCAADLRRFAEALSKRGGFASAIGALLLLHATMYDEANRTEAAS